MWQQTRIPARLILIRVDVEQTLIKSQISNIDRFFLKEHLVQNACFVF